jgi:endonuclease IV
MKKHTGYYVVGAVLVGVGIYLYSSRQKAIDKINLAPPMVVTEENDGTVTTTTTETTILSGLDKLKEIIDSIKSKGAKTPSINA